MTGEDQTKQNHEKKLNRNARRTAKKNKIKH